MQKMNTTQAQNPLSCKWMSLTLKYFTTECKKLTLDLTKKNQRVETPAISEKELGIKSHQILQIKALAYPVKN